MSQSSDFRSLWRLCDNRLFGDIAAMTRVAKQPRSAFEYFAPEFVTSNLPFDEWTSVFGSARLTGALLDRLTHHVHILEMHGESYRLAHSKRRARKAKANFVPPDQQG